MYTADKSTETESRLGAAGAEDVPGVTANG